MIDLKIDNIAIKTNKGTSLIEAARLNGIKIPSLCYKKELKHYTSCMVCMIKDNNTGKFLPSCSAIASNGMDIDTSGTEVVNLRKEALSLLLIEHRAECEAPCKNVCPASYNIPLINRLITLDEMNKAFEVIKNSIKKYGFACENCKAPCEKVCRRKMIDRAISIRNIITSIYSSHSHKLDNKPFVGIEQNKKFNSTIGKIKETEKAEWLKECPEDTLRYESPKNTQELSSEAANCMHCDCRAIDNCRLRELCEEYSVSNPPRLRIGPPIEKKININNGLIFENAKCIKCGLCVRASTDSINSPSLCFTGRGFMSLLSEPAAFGFDETYKNDAKKVTDICPTGALSIRK